MSVFTKKPLTGTSLGDKLTPAFISWSQFDSKPPGDKCMTSIKYGIRAIEAFNKMHSEPQ